MGDKTKEQLLEELAEVQKMLEERTATQGQMIKKFQMLIANEGLFSQIIDYFPYPLAIFTPQYTLVMVNKAFTEETKMQSMNRGNGCVSILKHKVEDTRLVAAVTQVFTGEISLLEDLKNPFSMFSGIPAHNAPQSDRYNKVVVFPVSANDAKITHGVIVFM
jgi:AraC family transcriptional regulator